MDGGHVRVAVVGLGYWGPNLVRVLHDLDSAEVAAVCDADSGKLEKVHRRYPGVAAVESFDAVVGDATIDAVVLATPVSTHHPLAMRALSAGKHVFVEKPLASAAADAAEMAAVASERGLVLMPGHTFLYSPSVNVVKSLIDNGDLGEVYFVSTSRVNLGLHQKDVSVLWDLAPHDLSILRYWLGENPVAVSALARACVLPGTPDVAFINLTYPSGTVAHVELSWLAPSKLRRTAVVGSRKMVVYDDTSSEPVRVFDSGVSLPDPTSFGEYKLSYRTGDIVSPAIAPVEPLSLELADFCGAILEGRVPRSSAQVGLDVVAAIEAVDAALDGGGIAAVPATV